MIASQFEVRELLPPWPSSFPERLAAILASQLLGPKGFALRRYSTADFLRVHLATPGIDELGHTWAERVEFLSPQVCARFESVGLRFPVIREAALLGATDVFRRVKTLLEEGDSGLQASVESLVKAVHIIESNGPDYDCSFSDPEIPFSIFISIPDLTAKNREFRVFEAIVHECMHLQLTAFELQVPIVRAEGGDARSYSPWKKSLRKVQGILHGMYVFHVVAYAYSILIESGFLVPSEMTFARRRLRDIASELDEVRGIETSSALTPAGIILARMLLVRSGAHI